MSLILKKSSEGIMYGTHNFSTKTSKLLEACIQELLSCGIPVGNRVCYFYLKDGKWYLNISTKNIGFLGKEDNKVFRDLLDSIRLDYQGDFDIVVFPNSLKNNPFGNYLVVFKEDNIETLEDFIRSSVKVVAYSNRSRVPLSLNNFCFCKGSGAELKELILSCGSASDMANRLNKSGFGYRNWVSVKDDFNSMKISSEDRLGNIYFIEVRL